MTRDSGSHAQRENAKRSGAVEAEGWQNGDARSAAIAQLHIGLASYSIQGQRFLFIEADLASKLARRGVFPGVSWK